MQFRAELRRKLKELNMGPQDLAKILGVHQSTVRMWHDYASEPSMERQHQVLAIIKNLEEKNKNERLI